MIILRNLLVIACWILLPLRVAADSSVVILKSGEQVIGEVLSSSTDHTLVIRSRLLGELKIPRSSVASMDQKAPASKPPERPKKPESNPEAVPEQEDRRQIVQTLKELKAPRCWSGYLRLGMNMSQGDTKWTQTYTRARLVIDPKHSPHYFRYIGSYTYRQTERENGTTYKSTDTYDGELTYRRTVLEKWFIQHAANARVDQIKGIDRETMGILGVGYTYTPSDTVEFIIGAGGGVEDVDTAVQDNRDGLNPIANVFQEASWKLFKRTSFVQRFNYYWNPENADYYKYVFSAALRLRLTDLLGFQFSYEKSYDNDVGTNLSRDDTQWRNALVLFF